ncbi:MAG TPA: 2-C-methyl-D-erythritol 4-phosphate cytidylyltransferase [Dyadobacter sp.]|jgi:2-C-methyl-D-erythritol 4-phosphate cytidylyltransferase|nr:2-C-methyl-D-erythritol 4-phosphate cytidylyltransferase [Dyadobacter sp.]
MKEFVIIVAGGSGSRMKSEIPKQFISVNGLPILMHTLMAFRNYADDIQIVLVLPGHQISIWDELCLKYGFEIKHQIVEGGETRFHSVRNGLLAILDEEALISVHDGVRPVITNEMISEGFKTAARYGTAITSVPVKDSVRSIDKHTGSNKALDRSSLRLIQTPQTFRSDWMRSAFSQTYSSQFTDCASVLESAGYTIELIEGAYENIKITTPEDLHWAAMYLPDETQKISG